MQIESSVKLVDGKLFRVARMKVGKDFKKAVQTDWRGRKFRRELQLEVTDIGNSFTYIRDGLGAEHCCSGTRS